MNITRVPSNISREQRIEWMTKNLDKFCVLPWLNLNTNPNGNIKLCCNIQIDHFVSDGTPFNLGYDDIDNIWQSKYMKSVREFHRYNQGSDECHECYTMEKMSGHSPRIGQNTMWIQKQKNDANLTDYLAEVSSNVPITEPKQLPVSLELRLGNQCNLKCISCWGMSSSLIHEERKEFLNKNLLDRPELNWLKTQWTMERDLVDKTNVDNWFETDIFYSNFKKLAPALKRLYTTGGEPTVIKSNYKMFQLLLDAGNTDCRIEFTSNMTNWNPLFYDKLSKFKNVEIQMSIDGIDEIGEYIRYPSNFAKVRENMFKVAELVSLNSGWRLKCYTVLQALNYKHLVPIWDLLNQLTEKYRITIDWWPITLSSPDFLSLAAVPLEDREAYVPILKAIAAGFNKREKYFCLGNGTVHACLESIANATFQSELQTRLANFIIFTDKQRLENKK
jgi:organic radical activating enzyme